MAEDRVTDRPARAPITRNGVTRRLYENEPDFGQKMTTDGKVMMGKEPNRE